MRDENFLLKNGFRLFMPVLFFSFITFMLGVVYDLPLVKDGGIFSLIVFILLRIFLYAGTYSSLVEIMAGEKLLLRFNSLCRNAYQFSFPFLLLSFIPFIFAVFFKKSLETFRFLNFSSFYGSFHIIILCIFSFHVIRIKYLKGKKNIPAKIILREEEIIVIFFLCFVNIFLLTFPLIIDIGYFDLQNFFSFLWEVFSYLEFLFFVYLFVSRYPEVEEKYLSQKEIYLINPYPFISDKIGGLSAYFYNWYPPIFVVIKALTPKGYKIREFNNIIFEKRFYRGDILVAITSCSTSNMAEAYKIAKGFRSKGAKVIMGGPHVSFLPDEALEFCDSVVIGEAEGVWGKIVEDYENNSLKPRYCAMPSPKHCLQVHAELLKSSTKVIKESIRITKGCKNRCDFCVVPHLYSRQVSQKSINDVLQLIKKIKNNISVINFIDDNVYVDSKYAKELFSAIKPLKIKWTASSSIDIAKSQEILKLAQESGCFFLLIGYEVRESSLEKKKGGKFVLVDQYLEYSKRIKDAGIRIKGGFIIGWDSDDYQSIWHLWKFCFRLYPDVISVALLVPYPGTEVYDNLLSQNRIINLNWKKYTTDRFVFQHKNINSYMLSKFYFLIVLAFALNSKIGRILFFLMCFYLVVFIFIR